MRANHASDRHPRPAMVRRGPERGGIHGRTRGVVELVGPAGAGKTTLAVALRDFRPAPRASRIRLIGGLMSAAPALAVARLSARGRFWSRDELRSLAYLSAWQRGIRAGHEPGQVVFDHGPVFRLASISAFGPPMTGTRAFTRLWRRWARQWGQLLDVVVWLDAPDEVLLDRIAGRAQEHRIRGATADEAERFLARYRVAYRATLAAVTRDGPALVEFDTARWRPDELAAAVHAAVPGSGG